MSRCMNQHHAEIMNSFLLAHATLANISSLEDFRRIKGKTEYRVVWKRITVSFLIANDIVLFHAVMNHVIL